MKARLQPLLAVLVPIVSILLAPHSASAILINDVSDDFTIQWSLSEGASGYGGTVPFDMRGTATFDVVSLSSIHLELDVNISNSTANQHQSAITSFGFAASPSPTLAFLHPDGKVFDNVALDWYSQGTFPRGYEQIDICLSPSTGCGGDIRSGLGSGRTDSFTLVLLGWFGSSPSVEFSVFPASFSTESYQGIAGPGSTPTTTAVPEPGTLILLGTGLIAARLLERRLVKSKTS